MCIFKSWFYVCQCLPTLQHNTVPVSHMEELNYCTMNNFNASPSSNLVAQ